MKLTIRSSGEDPDDDNIVGYELVAETAMHKTTLSFYDLADAFDNFARELEKFPFEQKQDVVFEHGYWPNTAGQCRIAVRLLDTVGRVVMAIETMDLATDLTTKAN